MDGSATAVQDVFRTAGRSDVVIHAVSLAGLEGPVDLSSRTGSNSGRGQGLVTLAALAENTGGRFVLPTNDFARALAEMEQVSRQYYVLAFQPAEPAAKRGRPRSLKVRVQGAGLSGRTAPRMSFPRRRRAWTWPPPGCRPPRPSARGCPAGR